MFSRVIRQIPGVKVIDGTPMEKARVFPDSGAIDAYYSKAMNHINGVPRECIVNMAESGFADFVDARPERVIVPTYDPKTSVPIPVSRSIKRLTMVAGIAADGNTLKPSIVVARVAVEAELFSRPVRKTK